MRLSPSDYRRTLKSRDLGTNGTSVLFIPVRPTPNSVGPKRISASDNAPYGADAYMRVILNFNWGGKRVEPLGEASDWG
jgi:hypothetical protein